MIINDIKPTLEVSGDMEVKSFDVKDLGFLFDILRNKMYGSPITAICRELASNAVDAHREAGKHDSPIQITLPNAIEPNLRITDFGVGISPERAEEIYRWYGASTKRDSNDQIGGWGLGAKIGFSYVDQWSVETIYNHTKYCYAAAIDPTKVGKLILLSKEASDQSNGTTVIIPIKPSDFGTFHDAVEFTTRHFNPRPTIKGGKITYQELECLLEGSNWKIVEPTYQTKGVKIIVDCIEYPFDPTHLPNYHSIKFLHATRDAILLTFNTGELSLSASREAIHLDPPTIAKIVARCETAYNELRATVQAKIDACFSLYEANACYTTTRQSLPGVCDGMKWKDIELQHEIYLSAATCVKRGGGYNYSRQYIRFNEPQRTIYLNDLDLEKVDHKTLKPAFDADASLKEMYVVSGYGKDFAAKQENLANLVELHHLDQLGAIKLSSAITIKPKRKTAPRLNVFVFKELPPTTVYYSRYGRRHASQTKTGWGWRRVKFDIADEDKNIRVLATLEQEGYGSPKERRALLNDDERFLSNDNLRAIIAGKEGISIYGLDKTVAPEKIKEHFAGYKKLDEFVKEQFEKDELDFVKLKAIERINNEMKGVHHDMILGLVKVAGAGSIIQQYDERHKAQQELLTKENLVKLKSYESFVEYIEEEKTDAWKAEHPDQDLPAMRGKILDRYPLLGCLNSYDWERHLDDLGEYLGFIDSKNGLDKANEGD